VKLAGPVLLVAAAALGAQGCSQEPPAPAIPTFSKDVAPIVYSSCASCHRPDGIAPFSLLTYADAASHADEIADQVASRHMPPWLPEPGEFPFVGDRRLRDDQIATLKQWAAAGAPEGNARDLPPRPSFADGWQLGRPDAIVTLPKPYVVRPGTEDIYRNLVLPTSLTSDVYVRAVEFQTGGAPIHHAVIRMDRTAASRRRDGEDGQPGFDGMAWQGVQDPDGHFVGWAPGRGPIAVPDGMPWRLDRGASLVVEVHLLPSDVPIDVQPTVGLFFTAAPPVHRPLTVRMGSKLIDIPAGESNYVVTDSYELPVPVELLGVYPHAHYLGREMLATATMPGGVTKTLLHIRHWNFHWQQDYRYAAPIALPAGTRLTMRYVYDNSAANEHNPHAPPVRVRAGPESTDEMAELGLQLLPKSREDANRIAAAFAERELLANIALGESRVREEPNVAEYRVFLGGAYVDAGRFAEAVPHLEAALRLKDRSADTYNYLGAARMAEGRVAEALTQFQRAASAAPRDERLHFNVGTAQAALSRAEAAEAAFRRALAINPEYTDAHVNLGLLLIGRGRMPEALTHFQRAVDINPESAFLQNNLAGALAMAGRYAEAMRHVERALQLQPGYGPALDNLQKLKRIGG
jgi:tetratricopeptide (TPR) repeat protein